jgi:hypothetical protein
VDEPLSGEPGPEELEPLSPAVVATPPWSPPPLLPSLCPAFAPGAGAGEGPLDARDTGCAESPMESPEIAFAASAIAPAATTPTMPSKMVSNLSLLVTISTVDRAG